jgi:small subunit ribosomal protein S16
MAVKMRLRREGKKKQPFYRVVIADVRAPRDGRFIEDIGYYQPLHDPSTVHIDRERALYWLHTGVQPSDAVVNLLRIEGIWAEFRPGDSARPTPPQPARRGRPAPAPGSPEAAAAEPPPEPATWEADAAVETATSEADAAVETSAADAAVETPDAGPHEAGRS